MSENWESLGDLQLYLIIKYFKNDPERLNKLIDNHNKIRIMEFKWEIREDILFNQEIE